jgi:hypothetical protein
MTVRARTSRRRPADALQLGNGAIAGPARSSATSIQRRLQPPSVVPRALSDRPAARSSGLIQNCATGERTAGGGVDRPDGVLCQEVAGRVSAGVGGSVSGGKRQPQCNPIRRHPRCGRRTCDGGRGPQCGKQSQDRWDLVSLTTDRFRYPRLFEYPCFVVRPALRRPQPCPWRSRRNPRGYVSRYWFCAGCLRVTGIDARRCHSTNQRPRLRSS